ncbi:IclR family transcriptional regulator [Microbacterium sp. CH12i]|uniref:IclR family transcriptional regulator n=1 Tax=Microbacterium sp. CH12i TaxID=1479651 RepID=UPI0005684A0D|nr:IclR family transcriptional regulator C-terminal domain-containing protein [Microbacterium sp. CH12i]
MLEQTRTRRSTGSVTLRAMRMLDAFEPARMSLSLSELARFADVPLSTAHRLLSDLCTWGALERDVEGRFHVGVRIRQLAALAPRGRLLREVCLPVMEDLVAVTACSCVLAVLEDTDVINVEVVRGTRSEQKITGQRSHALTTAAGRVLVAFAPAGRQREVLERPVPALTSHTVTDSVKLRAILAEVRQARGAVSRQQADDDFTGVAAPVIDATGEVVGALSTVVPVDASDLGALMALTTAAARSVSRVLQPLMPRRPS